MTDFTNLLAQAAPDTSNAPTTLADTLRKHAKDYTDEDLLVLIEGLREQRTRWAEAQREGSRKPVTSKKIAAKPPAGFKIKTPTI